MPKSFREFLDLRAGDRPRYFIADGGVHIMPARSVKCVEHCGTMVLRSRLRKWSKPSRMERVKDMIALDTIRNAIKTEKNMVRYSKVSVKPRRIARQYYFPTNPRTSKILRALDS